MFVLANLGTPPSSSMSEPVAGVSRTNVEADGIRYERLTASREATTMILRRLLGVFVFAALALQAATAGAINPFGRSGFELTNSDVAILTETTRPFYDDDTVPIGTAKSWSNPKSGNRGTATLIGRFEQKGMPCRRVQHDIKLKTVADPFRFIIDRCRVADGTWKML